MKVIKKVNIISVAKFSGFLIGSIYLIIGLGLSIAVFILDIPIVHKFDFLGLGSAFLATLLITVLMGAIGSLLGLILAWLFNLLSKFVGGIEIELEEASMSSSKILKKKKEASSEEEKLMFSRLKPQKDIDELLTDPDSLKTSNSEEKRDTFTF